MQGERRRDVPGSMTSIDPYSVGRIPYPPGRFAFAAARQ